VTRAQVLEEKPPAERVVGDDGGLDAARRQADQAALEKQRAGTGEPEHRRRHGEGGDDRLHAARRATSARRRSTPTTRWMSRWVMTPTTLRSSTTGTRPRRLTPSLRNASHADDLATHRTQDAQRHQDQREGRAGASGPARRPAEVAAPRPQHRAQQAAAVEGEAGNEVEERDDEIDGGQVAGERDHPRVAGDE